MNRIEADLNRALSMVFQPARRIKRTQIEITRAYYNDDSVPALIMELRKDKRVMGFVRSHNLSAFDALQSAATAMLSCCDATGCWLDQRGFADSICDCYDCMAAHEPEYNREDDM